MYATVTSAKTSDRVARAQFRERMLSVADVQIEDSSDFEVTFADLRRRLAELSR